MARDPGPRPLPEWATLQLRLRDELRAAAPEFVARYTRPDGTLAWRAAWPGMDGSDDPYEAFMYLALFAAIDGDADAEALARRMWDRITWQWTEYGQLDREFDRGYDWMHHGEGSLFLYFLGLTSPESVVDRQRARRFARMYTGEDPLAPNFDPELGIIRAPHTGSDGPRFELTAEDYSSHREVLADYPPPFEDLTTVPAGATTCDWLDDDVYAEMLATMNARTSRGDVPVNLNATGLLTHAHLFSGDPAQRDWVVDYLAAWTRRARENGGILPDNVGLSGVVGEYLDGAWWGGHYGWRWPHGLLTVIEPALTAGLNAYLLTGDAAQLELARGQLDRNHELGHDRDGVWVTPHRHLDAGWADYRPPSRLYGIHLWAATLAEEDRERAERCAVAPEELVPRTPRIPFAHKHYNVNTSAWFEFASGRAPGYPAAALRANLDLVAQQLERLRSEEGDPDNWPGMHRLLGRTDGPGLQTDGYAIHAWQEFCPVYLESLVQLMWGAPAHLPHGGLQHATLRYFDPATRRAGLPRDVAALVDDLTPDGCRLTLVNAGAGSRAVVVQGGAFGEHLIASVAGPDGTRTTDGARTVELEIPPGSTVEFRIGLARRAGEPSYETPWSRRADWPPLIEGRDRTAG